MRDPIKFMLPAIVVIAALAIVGFSGVVDNTDTTKCKTFNLPEQANTLLGEYMDNPYAEVYVERHGECEAIG